MPRESSLEIVGPTGATVVTFDERGIVYSGGVLERKQINYTLVAVPVATYIFECITGIWKVETVSVLARVTGGAAATLDVLVCQQVEAVASGVTQLGAVVDIEETAPFRARPALIAALTEIFPGDSVAVNLGGTATGIIGLLTVVLKKVG